MLVPVSVRVTSAPAFSQSGDAINAGGDITIATLSSVIFAVPFTTMRFVVEAVVVTIISAPLFTIRVEALQEQYILPPIVHVPVDKSNVPVCAVAVFAAIIAASKRQAKNNF
jgi:hypothetical protein